jgi:hypothetical protein
MKTLVRVFTFQLSNSMKLIFTILMVFLIINCFGQKKSACNKHSYDTTNQVCFVTKFHITDLDKDDAAILKGYVVEIGYEQATKLFVPGFSPNV